MEVYDAAKTILAVRDYTHQPLADEVVHKILDAGRLSASRKNRQPWHFVVVRDRERLAQLGDLAPSGDYIREAAMAVAVFLESDDQVTVIDGTRAIQSMMLVAWGEGVGSNWVGRLERDTIKHLLDMPDDFYLLTVVPFGYPARKIGLGKKDRKPLLEVAHAERYGQPIEN